MTVYRLACYDSTLADVLAVYGEAEADNAAIAVAKIFVGDTESPPKRTPSPDRPVPSKHHHLAVERYDPEHDLWIKEVSELVR